MDLPSNAVLQQDAPENLGDSVDPFIASLVNSQLVVDAGSDSEGRTILVLYSCYLPDPDTCDYDCLLRALVHRLEKYVETDYILVIFATGSRHRPSMVWMLKAYQQLERKLSVKIIGAHSNRSYPPNKPIQVMSPVISVKFRRKIEWIHNIAALGLHMPIQQIRIPKLIREIDANRPAQLQRPQSSSSAIHMISGFASWVFANAGFGGVLPENTKDRQFAVPLNAIMGQNGERGIPRVVDDCIRFILQNGLETEGLFRISPSQQFVNALHDMYDSGEVTIDIASNGGVHSAAGLLKMFFRELPEPIIPGEMYDTFRMIQSNPESAHAIFAKTVLLPILPQSAQILLRALFHMLHTLHLNKDTTLMPAANLAIVWAPNFVRSTNPMVDLGMCTLGPTGGGVGTFVRVAIEEWDEVFGNTFENFDDGIFVDEDQLKPVADSSETESGPASGSSRPSSGNSALGENRRQGSKAPSQLAKEYTSDTDSDEISSMNFSLSRHDGSGSGSGRSTSVRNSASYDPSRSTVPLATPEEYVSDASGVVRTRTRTIRGKANRGTIVAAEDSSLAMLGAGLSQTTLADASRVGFGGGEKLSLA